MKKWNIVLMALMMALSGCNRTTASDESMSESIEEAFDCSSATLTIKGGGLLSSIKLYELNEMPKASIALSPVYEIYAKDHSFDEAVLTLNFKYDGTEADVGIYRYLDDGSYELVCEGTSGNAELFSYYFLGIIEKQDEDNIP